MQAFNRDDTPFVHAGNLSNVVKDVFRVLCVAVKGNDCSVNGTGARRGTGRVLDENAAVDRGWNVKRANRYFTGAGTVSVRSYFLSA